MDTDKLLKKIAQYKQELTFDSDKRAIEGWERSIKGSIVRAEIAKMDGIKDLIKQLEAKIVKCNFVLQNDRNLTAEERDKLFTRKEEQQWLVSFFEEGERQVEAAEEKIDKELE